MNRHRLIPLSEGQWDKKQQDCVVEMVQGSRGAILPPFEPLLYSPELCTHTQRMGAYLRYNSVIGQRLSELVILIVARYWNQSVEWAIHAPIALEKGISANVINHINNQQIPLELTDEELCIYHFCHETLNQKKVTDKLWQEAIARFDTKGVIDLIGLIGYYTFLSFVMNNCQTLVPINLKDTLINHL